jgi:hypothetical protein
MIYTFRRLQCRHLQCWFPNVDYVCVLLLIDVHWLSSRSIITDVCVDRRLALKWILQQLDGEALIGLLSLRREQVAGERS